MGCPVKARPFETRNSCGHRLVGVLTGHLDSSVVVCCHGMLSSKNGTKHQALAQALAAEGLPSLRFDFSGHGGSEGRLYEMSYSRRLEDLQAVIDALAGEGVERFGLFGSSMGGTVAYLAAARDERIAAIATLAAVAHPELAPERHPNEATSWRERGFIDTELGPIGPQLLEDALCHDVLAAVGVIRAPILVIHGERDEVVPVSDAHDIATAARHVALEIVYGADHRFQDPVHLRPAIAGIVGFFGRIFGPQGRDDSGFL